MIIKSLLHIIFFTIIKHTLSQLTWIKDNEFCMSNRFVYILK